MFNKLIVGAAIFVGVVAVGGYLIGKNNEAVRIENAITAQYEQNQNNLSQFTTSVMEAAQVPAMARKDIEAIVKTAMQGRYGENGSKAAVQMITEAYPGQIDPSLYVKIQNMIESGRRNFEQEQKILIDKVRVYKTSLGTIPGGFVMKAIGYPTINLDDYKPVVSDYTNNAFTTKRDNGVQLGK